MTSYSLEPDRCRGQDGLSSLSLPTSPAAPGLGLGLSTGRWKVSSWEHGGNMGFQGGLRLLSPLLFHSQPNVQLQTVCAYEAGASCPRGFPGTEGGGAPPLPGQASTQVVTTPSSSCPALCWALIAG